MDIVRRINAFAALGRFMKLFEETPVQDFSDHPQYLPFLNKLQAAYHHNGWFTENNVRAAMAGITGMLEKEQLEKWTDGYKHELAAMSQTKKVGVIMAGNIPLVGFHDMLSVLMCGHALLAKMSAQDKILLPALAEILLDIEPGFRSYIQFTDEQLKGMDAIIATGSNNTARYFEYYFRKYPTILRKNRNSVAVLSGKETAEELKKLGQDIFQYFGLGCRNVSKLFVPAGYDFDPFFNAVYQYKHVIENKKYANNYDYNKAVYLLNGVKLLENGFLLLKEDRALASPVSTLFYEYYTDKQLLRQRLVADASLIQCIVSGDKEIQGSVAFGQAQYPQLWDYADGEDTMQFLIELGK